MKAEVGDRIIVEAEKVGQSTRTGVIEEVLAPEPPRLRVRWDDGHSTVFAPTGGCRQDRACEAIAVSGPVFGNDP